MTESLRPSSTYSVVYRSGGTHDCRWTRILTAFPSRALALACVTGIERAGRRAFLCTPEYLAFHGLPVGWEPGMVEDGDDVTVSPLETRHIKAGA